MNCAGVQQLMLWGGDRAHEIVSTTSDLEANQPRLAETADTWHRAASAVRASTDAVEQAGTQVRNWDGAAAQQFQEHHQEHLERGAALESAYRRIGDAVARMADSMGETHAALVAATEAAGRTVAALDPPVSPTAPAGSDAASGSAAAMPVVVEAWSALAEQLVKNCERVALEVAAELNA